MTKTAKHSPETQAALDRLAAVFWRLAVDAVEAEMSREVQKPLPCVKLLRRDVEPKFREARE